MKELFIIDHISLIKTEKSPRIMEPLFIKMNNIRKVYKYRNIRKQKISKIFETN
jgi:hypothetical protein